MEGFNQESQALSELEVVDVLPEKEAQGLPVFIAPGWGNTSLTFKNIMGEFTKNGHRSLLVEHKRAQTMSSIDEQYSTEDLQRAFEIIEALDKKGIAQTDAVGYSEGTIDLVVAATLFPERFRSLVLLNPNGVIGEDSFAKLVARFHAEIARNTVSSFGSKEEIKATLAVYKDVASEILKNPALAARETLSIAKSNTLPALANLKQKGIRISIIAGVDDKMFPIKKMQEEVKAEHVDGFYSVKGGHFEAFKKPEQYTSLIRAAFSALEKKSEKKAE